jgi:outer membrane receptor protein involved in Fe transport
MMKSKKNLLIALMMCFVSTIGYAATVKGTIIDGANGQPFGYVNVALKKAGQAAPVKGVVSDDKGNFVLEQVSSGRYVVEFTFVGYNTLTKPITVNGSQLDLGSVTMTEASKTLSEVQVRGQGPQMKLEIDKKTFTVDQTIAAAGASTSEMLRNIPSVDVDNQGNISLRNNSNVEVWINGKPSGLNADNRAQILEQMPAESIEKVEIITNPSAKYNPEGSAGIINLVLKQDRKPGYYGSFSGGINYPEKGDVGYNAGFNINLNTSKIDAYASIGMRQMSMSGSGWSNRYKIDPATGNQLGLLATTSNTDRTMHGPFIRAGLDYHIDKKNTIGFGSFLMLGSGSMPARIDYRNYDAAGNLLNQYARTTSSSGNRNMFNLDINYKHEFDKNGTELLSTFSVSSHPSQSDAGHIQYNALGVQSSTQSQHTSGKNPEVEFKTDYTKKFGDNTRLETGFDGRYEQRYTDITGQTNGIDDPALANIFDYREQNYAAYATFASKWGNFGAQLGLRGEYSYINFTSDGIKYNINYIKPFPSLYLTYSFDKNDELQLNYTRRLNRPRGRSLNPYVDMSDTTSWSFGNPHLTPEYTNSFELNYLKSWDAHSLSASLYYRFTTDVMQSVRWIENDIMMNTTMNGSKTESSGLELVVKDNFFRFINLTTTFNFFYNKMHAAQFTPVDTVVYIPAQDNFSWNVKSIANVMLPANFSLQLIGSYNAPYIISQGKNHGNYSIDFGLRKSFFKRKLTANLTVRDIFNSRKDNVDTWGSNFTQQSLNYYNGRMIGINLNYNFGNNASNAKKQRNRQQNEDNSNQDNMMNDM